MSAVKHHAGCEIAEHLSDCCTCGAEGAVTTLAIDIDNIVEMGRRDPVAFLDLLAALLDDNEADIDEGELVDEAQW